MKIAVGCDHGGLHLKQEIKELLSTLGHEVEDFGTHSTESCDYPDIAEPVAHAVVDGTADRGILICGTGIGIGIAKDIVTIWLNTEFEGGRHARRIEKISALEK